LFIGNLNEKTTSFLDHRISYLVLIIGLHTLYFPINRTIRGGWLLEVSWDALIPFWPMWGIPYLASILWWLGSYIWAYLKMDTPRFQALIIGMAFTLVTSYLVYIVFPTYIERPNVVGTGWQHELIRLIFDNDRVNNAFPSGHTYSTMLIVFFWWQWQPKYRWLWAAIAIIIILSTLFTGQHNLLDPLGGIAWAWFGYLFGNWWAQNRRLRDI